MRIRGWMVAVIPLVIAIAANAPSAVALFASLAGSAAHGPDHLQQVVVPGKGSVKVAKPGEQKIFYEYVSRVDGKNYNTSQAELGVDLKITDPSGHEVDIDSPGNFHENYSGLDGRFGYLEAVFPAEHAGTYTVVGKADDDIEARVIAIGPGLFNVPRWSRELARWGNLVAVAALLVLLFRWSRDREPTPS